MVMIWVGWVADDDSVVSDTQLAFGCTQIRRQVSGAPRGEPVLNSTSLRPTDEADPERTETEDSCSNGVDGMEVG
jgi:hypothetical protein